MKKLLLANINIKPMNTLRIFIFCLIISSCSQKTDFNKYQPIKIYLPMRFEYNIIDQKLKKEIVENLSNSKSISGAVKAKYRYGLILINNDNLHDTLDLIIYGGDKYFSLDGKQIRETKTPIFPDSLQNKFANKDWIKIHKNY